MIRYLLIALKNPDGAQEVAQDVFARALGGLKRFDPSRGEFRDWLFSIDRSVAIDHLRKGARAEEVDFATVPSHVMPIAERASSLTKRLDPDSGVRSIIDDLPELQRQVLAMRFVFGLSTDEISDVVGSTPDAIRHVQHRALKALAGAMGGRRGWPRRPRQPSARARPARPRGRGARARSRRATRPCGRA